MAMISCGVCASGRVWGIPLASGDYLALRCGNCGDPAFKFTAGDSEGWPSHSQHPLAHPSGDHDLEMIDAPEP